MENKQGQETYIIGIAGGTGSGKTTFARELVMRLGTSSIIYLSHDSYYKDLGYLPLEERKKKNFDHPDLFETDLMVKQINQLKNGETINVPVYDFTQYTRSKEVMVVKPQPIILIEGILVLAVKELRDLMDIRLFVDTDADIRFMRRLHRDMIERGRTMDSVFDQYLAQVRPMHEAFVEPSKSYADMIIPRGGYNQPALDMVAAKIRSQLPDEQK